MVMFVKIPHLYAGAGANKTAERVCFTSLRLGKNIQKDRFHDPGGL